MSSLKPVTSPSSSLASRAYDALRAAIITCQLRPGESLVETRLVADLQVSKTPVREALVRLAEVGLVTWTPFHGYAVAPIHRADIAELSQLRSVLEGLAAREAAVRLTDEQLDDLDDIVERSRQKAARGRDKEAGELGHLVHLAVHENCGNQRLTRSIARLNDEFDRLRHLAGPARRPERDHVDDHEAVVAALRSRDPDRAESVLRDHLAHVFDYWSTHPDVLAAIDAQPGQSTTTA